MNLKYNIGLRAVKTAIAIFGCFLIGVLFHRESVFYSSIAAVMCMQTTHEKTFEMGFNRFVGTVIGGACGFLILQYTMKLQNAYNWLYVFMIPVCILILIYICNVLNKKNSVAICCIVFLSIVTNYSRNIPDTFLYVINRVIDTSIGIAIAILINRFIFPRYEKGKDADI